MSVGTCRQGQSVGQNDILVQMLDYTIQTFYREVSSSCFSIRFSLCLQTPVDKVQVLVEIIYWYKC